LPLPVTASTTTSLCCFYEIKIIFNLKKMNFIKSALLVKILG
jgi:hypothetical protein